MRLLVSVVDEHEAHEAAAAGADIVDVKNPGEGALGAAPPAVIERVRAAVPARVPVSAAIGDMPNLPGTAALAALGAARSGAAFVKVGLWGASTERGGGRPAAQRSATAWRPCRARCSWPRPTPMPGAWRTRRSRLSCCRAWRTLRASGSACSTRRSRTAAGSWTGSRPTSWRRWWTTPMTQGLQVALAGALRAEDLPAIRATGADIVGVRSAACSDGRRSGPLEAARVRALHTACAPPTPLRAS